MREKFLPAAQGRTKKLDHYPKLTGLFNSDLLLSLVEPDFAAHLLIQRQAPEKIAHYVII